MKTNSNHLENQLAKTKAEKTGEKIRAFAEESKAVWMNYIWIV